MTDTWEVKMPPYSINQHGLNFARDVNCTFVNCLSEYQLYNILDAYMAGSMSFLASNESITEELKQLERLKSKAARVDRALVELESMIDGDSPWDSQISNVIRILEGEQP